MHLICSVWYSPHHENAVWWHWMVVIVPRKFDEDMKNHVYMQIEAGSNGNNNYPNIHDNEDIDAAKILAVGGGIVTSIIFQGTLFYSSFNFISKS